METLEQLDNFTKQALAERDYQQAQEYAWQQLDIDNLRESAVFHFLSSPRIRDGRLCEGRNPAKVEHWISAFAGMTASE